MKSCQITTLALSILAVSTAPAATTNTYFSGDASGSTSSSLQTVFDMNAGNINSGYTGWMAANGYTYGDILTAPSDAGFTGSGRAGTDGFFNQLAGITTTPQVRFDAAITGGTGQLKFDLNSNGQVFDYEVIGEDVTEFQVTSTYLGVPNFRPGDDLSPGFTGRYSFASGTPQTNNRGWFGLYNQSSPDVGNITISAVDVNPLTLAQSAHVFNIGGGSNGSGTGVTGAGDQGDFYEGQFPNAPGIPLIPTLNPGGLSATLDNLSATSATLGNSTGRGGIFFHNGSDLSQLLYSVTYTLNKADGSAFADGTAFTLTFDAMAPFIPEPSRAVLLLIGVTGIFLRRRR